jgi:hypothetical protein
LLRLGQGKGLMAATTDYCLRELHELRAYWSDWMRECAGRVSRRP